MTRSKFIRLGGWSLMLGAATFILFIAGAAIDEYVNDPFRKFQTFTQISFLIFSWVTPVLLGLGMFGLRTRYGDEAGSLGKNILLFGGISGFPITLVGMFTAGSTEWGWILLFAGNAFLLVCLAVFGFLALQTKPLPRWNSLPIWAGLPFPVLMTTSITITSNTGQSGWNLVFSIFVMLQCIALFMLGYILQSDVPEETPVIA